MDKKVRINELVKEINRHSYNYYTLDNPTISDADWDAMLTELTKLEAETGYILPNSPTQNVGYEILKGFKKVNHPAKLYSLDKCNSYEELSNWLEDMYNKWGVNEFSVEVKYDGLRILAKFENGELVQASTRGNGVVGEDVTKQVYMINSFPKAINYKDHLIVMGEAMIRNSVLEELNKHSNEPLKNARNAAAGAIRNLDLSVVKNRNLDLFMYDILEVNNAELKTQADVHKFIIDNNFASWDYFKVTNKEGVIKAVQEIDKIKNSFDIMIDGAVVKVNNLAIRDKIGYTNKFPKWAIAYKYEAQEKTTKVNKIIWQVGRTGKLTPIAEIEPVELAGATVRRATLNNYGDIKRKDVKINSLVFVRRSNEVIPEILNVAQHNSDSIDIVKPEYCPYCGTKLVEDGANLFCPNKISCNSQVCQKIIHFCSRNAMNIEGVSDKTIELFRDKLDVNSPVDLYYITREELLQLDSFKSKKADNFLKSIEKSKQCNFANFIYALGITGVGDKTSKDLANTFNSIEELMNASIIDLANINDIGEIIAASIYNYFRDTRNISEINELIDCGISINYNRKVIKDNQFNGKNVVISGTFDNFGRVELTEIMENLGASITSSVSKNTYALLLGVNAGSKLDKAKSLGIKIIEEDELLKLLNLSKNELK